MLNGDYSRKLKRGWVLRKHIGRGRKLDRSIESEWHTLSHQGLGVTLKRPEWEWADIDKGNLVFSEKGKLMRATIFEDKEQPYRAKLVHNFNPYAFKPIRAPY